MISDYFLDDFFPVLPKEGCKRTGFNIKRFDQNTVKIEDNRIKNQDSLPHDLSPTNPLRYVALDD